MLSGHHLIYFAPETWNGLWRNRQQLMSIFARHNKVLFVENRYYFKHALKLFRNGSLSISDLSQSPVRQVSENLYVFRYPIWVPITGRFDTVTKKIRQIYFQKALEQLEMRQPIVWFARPSMIDLIDQIPEACLRIYHIVDEYTSYGNITPTRHNRIEMQEKEMMKRVDAAVVVSPQLYKAKSLLNPNTYLVPNGVDCQAYNTALADETLPDVMQNVPVPRLGYSGLIGDRLNLTVLLNLAQKHPEWSLVFLGEVRVKAQFETWQTMLTLPNVYYLGSVAISQVPDYLKGFTVGLMPYKQDQHSENISPLKLYDYLAAGLPVASIDIPAAREFKTHIHLATLPQDFEQAVQAALADNGIDRYQARRELATQHTWEARVEQLSGIIINLLRDKAKK